MYQSNTYSDEGRSEKFLKDDMKKFGYTDIDLIVETTLEEARVNYDMENEQHFPILR